MSWPITYKSNLLTQFSFPIESLPVETEEAFVTLCRALKDVLLQNSIKANQNLLGGTMIQETTRLILRAVRGKGLRLTHVAQKKKTGKKVFKETKMLPFVRGDMLPFYLLFICYLSFDLLRLIRILVSNSWSILGWWVISRFIQYSDADRARPRSRSYRGHR